MKNFIFLIFLVYKFERRKCQMTLILSNKIIVLYVNGFHLIKWVLIKCYSIFKLFEKVYLILKSFFNFRSGHHHNYFKVELFIIRFNLIWAKKTIKLKYVNFMKYDLNRTENQFKSHWFGLVKVGFLGYKARNIIPIETCMIFFQESKNSRNIFYALKHK